MKRRSVVLSAVLGLAIVGGGVTAAKTVRDNITTQQLCQTLESRLAATGEVVADHAGTKPVSILGDSYTAADELDHRTDGWAYKLAAAEGWDASIAGVGSTGFVNQGPCGRHVYANRIQRAVDAKPDLLVIQGGLNDWKAAPADVEAAAGMLLDAAAEVPAVLVVGPVNAPSRAEGLPEVDAALARAAKANGAQYVSALGWELEFLPDRLHLTPAGHARLATLVAAELPD